MIEEQGTVVSVSGDSVWVETLRKTSCSGCKLKSGCGQHLAEKYQLKKNNAYIKAECGLAVSEGDQVVVGIPEGALLRASALVYLLPLIFLMGTLWFSVFAQLSDVITMLVAGGGLLLGFLAVRLLSDRRSDLCRVKIIRIVPPLLADDYDLQTVKLL